MTDVAGQLQSPGLAQLVGDLGKLVRNAADLRAIQARNAPQCAVLNAMAVVALAAAVRIPEAQGMDEFAFALVVVETTSGAGRYDPGTGLPATAARGLEIPAGGTIISLEGATNIRQFSIFGSGALAITYALFK
jgi:hypothetical protein